MHVISFITTERKDFVTYMQECIVEPAHQDKSLSQWRRYSALFKYWYAWHEESANQMRMDGEYLAGVSVDIDSKK